MSRLKGALADPLLSVVMPVYNERATIDEIIRRVLAVPIRIELIIVDDGSKDGTRDILSQLAATLPFASWDAPSAFDFSLLATMGIVQLGLGLFLFMRGAPHLTAAQVGLLTLLEVILAPIWVWLAFAEVPALLSLIGGAVVLSALTLHAALK